MSQLLKMKKVAGNFTLLSPVGVPLDPPVEVFAQ